MKKTWFKMKKTVVAFVLLSLLGSCGGFLDQEVTGNLDENEYYKTEADALSGLVAAYDSYSNTYNAIWPSMYLIRDIISDDVNAGGSDENDQAGLQQVDDFTHDSQNPHVQGAWANLWSAIYRANKVVNKTAPSSDLMKRVIAEARVLRAFMYMDLVSMWGGVPIIQNDVPASGYTTQVRATKAEVFAFLEADLALAIADLPIKGDYSAGDKFRVSKGTAQALLGKVYLFDEKWDEALDQFEIVIGSNQYELEDMVNACFDKMNEFGKESLFELNYIDFNGNDWGNYPWGNSTEDNIIVQLCGPRGDYYSAIPGDSLTGGWGFNTPTDELFQAYVDEGDADRRGIFLMSQSELETAGGGWSNASAWDYEGYFRRKYGHYNNQTGGPVGELNYATNFVLMRYADVLLMASEAAFESGDETKAKTYLNQVRNRPSTNLADVTASGAALLDAIRLERRLELAFEGHRFIDLVRWGLAATELADLGFVAGKHEMLPIPNADVISAKLTQNPGY